MKINWIEFENLDTGLKINKTEFNKELTMLVGLSGAGKTQILESISTFCVVATNDLDGINKQFNGKICFSISSEVFEWHICVIKDTTSIIPSSIKKQKIHLFFLSDTEETKVIIKSEKLLCNGKIIFERNNQKLVMNNQELPKSSNDFSLIYQYNNDDLIKKVYDAMDGLYNANQSFPMFSSMPISSLDMIKSEMEKCKTIEEYRGFFSANIPIQNKIYLLKETNTDLYNILKKYYTSIFPDVDDFIFELDYENQVLKTFIKTNDSNLEYRSISAGMKKTISFLVDMLTISNNNVVLIDEIENGLGVNCLDEVYGFLTSLRDDLQLIITSHHPYIINNVNPNSCKIVDRKKNIITTYSAKELNLTNSHHDFYDLVMNKLQQGGIS